jgi:hypothetical protein
MAVIPITSAPPLIDTAALPRFITNVGFMGPLQDSTNLYAALVDQNTGAFAVSKSTDAGLTWSIQDAAGEVAPSVAGMVPVFGLSGEIVWLFVSVDSGGGFNANVIDAKPFGFGSDTFGSLVSVTPTGDPIGSGRTFGGLRSDSSILMLFSLTVASINQAWAVVFSSGAFGSPFSLDVAGGDSVSPIGIVIDASDVAHVITFDAVALDTRYLTITLGGSVAAAVSIAAVSSASGVLDQPVAVAGTLAFPYLDGSGANTRGKLLYATGATSAPGTAAWTIYDIWTSGLEATSDDSDVFAVLDGSDLLVFWNNRTAAGISRMYCAKFNGSGFDAPVVFYDSSLYPPTGATIDPNMRGTSIAIIGGDFVGLTSMDIDGSGFESYYLVNGSAPPVSGYRNRVY